MELSDAQSAEALILVLRSDDAQQFHLTKAVAIRHLLVHSEDMELERELLMAALESRFGSQLDAARHRYYLAVLALREGNPVEAAGWLDSMEPFVGEDSVPHEVPYWELSRLCEAHHLALGRAEVARYIGFLDVAAAHAVTARQRLASYEAACTLDNQAVRPMKYSSQRIFDIDLELARMAYDRALNLIEDKEGARVEAWTVHDRFELERRRAAALSQLALEDPAYGRRAEDALAAILTEPIASRSARLDAAFRLIRLRTWCGGLEADDVYQGIEPEVWQSLAGDSSRTRLLQAAMALGAGEPSDSEPLQAWRGAFDAWLDQRAPEGQGGDGLGHLHFDDISYAVDAGFRALGELGSASIEESFDRFVRLVNPPRRHKGARVSGAALRNVLRPGEVAFGVLPSTHRGLGFVATRDGVHTFDTAGEVRLRRAVESLRDEVEQHPGDDRGEAVARWRARSSELRNTVFPGGEGAGVLAAQRILVLGRDLTFDIPWEALADGDTSLGCRVSISSIPFVDRFLASRRDTDPPPLRSLVVANVPDPHWQDPLRSAQGATELAPQRLSGWLIQSSEGELRTGAEATLERIRDGAMRNVGLAIWFAHGEQSPPSLPRPAIVLGSSSAESDGRFRAADVSAAGAPAAIILASCGVARGPQRLGSTGRSTLTGSFLDSGSRVVVSSVADLPLEATAFLLDGVSTALRSGKPMDDALIEARRRVAKNPGTEHPYFHSLLQLHGDPGWRPVEPERHVGLAAIWLALGGGLLLGASYLAVIKRRRRDGA